MTSTSREIVVGVDGSPSSKAALRWAEEYAEKAGGRLTLVSAWHWPMPYGAPLAFQGFDPEKDAQRTVDAAKAELDPQVGAVRTVVTQGHAGTVLTDAAKDAALLVVGTRGHGALVGVGLGSTSTFCVHHAHCVVVVVR